MRRLLLALLPPPLLQLPHRWQALLLWRALPQLQ